MLLLIVAPEAHEGRRGCFYTFHLGCGKGDSVTSSQVSLHSSDFTWDSPVRECVTHSDPETPPHELWDGMERNIYGGGTQHFQRVPKWGVEVSGRFPSPRRGLLGEAARRGCAPCQETHKSEHLQLCGKHCHVENPNSEHCWLHWDSSHAGTQPIAATSSRPWCRAFRKLRNTSRHSSLTYMRFVFFCYLTP